MEWTKSISVGDATIDAQHKQLLTVINDLHSALEENRDKAIISETVRFLNDYIYTHLRHEEEYLRRHGYPDYESHVKIHSDFVKRYEDFKKKLLEGGPVSSLAFKVRIFLGE